MTTEPGVVGVWVMSDDSLTAALFAAADGEPPDLILLSLYANAEVQTIGED